MQYLKSEDWTEFLRRFPEAAAFLRATDLRRELAYLRGLEMRNVPMNKCERRRLPELEELFAGSV